MQNVPIKKGRPMAALLVSQGCPLFAELDIDAYASFPKAAVDDRPLD